MKEKIDVTKVLSIAATVLGVAGTLLSSYTSEKQMEQTIDKKVKEALDAMIEANK